jgi:hypothetical protein
VAGTMRLLRDAGLSPQGTREFPVKATGTQKARPTNRGKAQRYTQTGEINSPLQSQRRPLKKAAAAKSLMGRLCAGRRGTGPDVLNDSPTAVRLAFEDDYVAAFGGDFSAGGDGG